MGKSPARLVGTTTNLLSTGFPEGIAYIAAVLRRTGHEVAI